MPLNRHQIFLVHKPFFFLLLVPISICFCQQKSRPGPPNRSIDSLISGLNKVYQQGQFAGFSVAIANEQGTLYENGFGFANKAAGKPYTAATLQNIGSISKTLVGIALLKAQELGKLHLDDSINQYLPFRVFNPHHPALPITLRHLATHTSTITDNEFYLTRNYVLKPGQNLAHTKLSLDDEQVFVPADSAVSLPEYLQNVLTVSGKWYSSADFLKYQPGEHYEYSNVATALTAYIVERATGVAFPAFTRQHILQPLYMNASGWSFAEVDFSRYSRLYYTPDMLLPFYSLVTYPDGNFITSASDLAKFLTELIKGYAGKGTVLSPASYREYFRKQLEAKHFTKRNATNPYSDGYNVGIFMGFSVAGNIGHTGGDPGVTTILFFDPKTRLGRLLIVNTNINDAKGGKEFWDSWNVLEKYQHKLNKPLPATLD